MAFMRITTDEDGEVEVTDVPVPADMRAQEESRLATMLEEKDRSRSNVAFAALTPVYDADQPVQEKKVGSKSNSTE